MQSSPTGDEYTASIPSGEGDIPTFITKPEGDGPFPCVIFFMDIFGPREELYQMCRRFASKGYLTVLPHLFYRDGSFACHPTQRSESEMQRALELNISTTNQMVASDTESIIDFLDIEESADSARVGTIGTC
ncbi:MAG: dienelactone hydrolase family protein, partial [Verrucomicrobiota bacterium]